MAAKYVSPAFGSNANSGAVGSPYQTVAYAMTQLAPGDTLYLRGQTYTGAANVFDSELYTLPSGTDWLTGAIRVKPYPGESVILQPPEGLHGIRLTSGAPSYLLFYDLAIDGINSTDVTPGSAPPGVYLSSGANHNRFLRLEVYNWPGFGVAFSRNNGNSPFNEVLDCRVHHCGKAAGAATEGHGLYISTSDNLFEGNEVDHCYGYGFHLYDNDGPKYVARNRVRRNRIHDCGRVGQSTYGIVVAWGADNEVDNNQVYRCQGGIQNYVEASGTKIRHNTITKCVNEAISTQYHRTAPVLRNNVTWDNGTDGLVDYGDIAAALGTFDELNTVTADPAFLDPDADDYQLLEASVAIDAGVDLTGLVDDDFDGNDRDATPDCGCYQYFPDPGEPEPEPEPDPGPGDEDPDPTPPPGDDTPPVDEEPEPEPEPEPDPGPGPDPDPPPDPDEPNPPEDNPPSGSGAVDEEEDEEEAPTVTITGCFTVTWRVGSLSGTLGGQTAVPSVGLLNSDVQP